MAAFRITRCLAPSKTGLQTGIGRWATQDAVRHFVGGPSQVFPQVPLVRDELSLGTQRMRAHAPGVGIVVTAFAADQAAHGTNSRKRLACTPLTALPCLNRDHATIHFFALAK